MATDGKAKRSLAYPAARSWQSGHCRLQRGIRGGTGQQDGGVKWMTNPETVDELVQLALYQKANREARIPSKVQATPGPV